MLDFESNKRLEVGTGIPSHLLMTAIYFKL
jgi:hypothetical protein